MKHAKSLCRFAGCPETLDMPGYCNKHKRKDSERFNHLAKAPGSREFYGSARWRKVSQMYRREHPMCEGCAVLGIMVKGKLVDHIIERPVLEAQGRSPFDYEYLQTLCQKCHNRKLAKRQSKFNKD